MLAGRLGWLTDVFWTTACIPGTMRQLPSGRNRRFSRDTIPLELNEGEIRHRNNSHSEMLVYGYLPLDDVCTVCPQKCLQM